jgi:hypothetical protein
MKRGSQGVLYCRCGRDKIIANGHCATCYTLKRQDEAYFGGLREAVLERDGYVCRASGVSWTSIIGALRFATGFHDRPNDDISASQVERVRI